MYITRLDKKVKSNKSIFKNIIVIYISINIYKIYVSKTKIELSNTYSYRYSTCHYS